VSLDGVKECDYPYANPLGERVLITNDVGLNRRRIIAALLLHENVRKREWKQCFCLQHVQV
jgi:hypothetical protein